jgi:hypothetical protein
LNQPIWAMINIILGGNVMGNFVRPSGKVMSIIRKKLVVGEITIQKLREQLPKGYNNLPATKLFGTLIHLAGEGAIDISEEEGTFWTKGTKPAEPKTTIIKIPAPVATPEQFIGKYVFTKGIVTHTITMGAGKVLVHLLTDEPPYLAE